jgi:hypothetical protein
MQTPTTIDRPTPKNQATPNNSELSTPFHSKPFHSKPSHFKPNLSKPNHSKPARRFQLSLRCQHFRHDLPLESQLVRQPQLCYLNRQLPTIQNVSDCPNSFPTSPSVPTAPTFPTVFQLHRPDSPNRSNCPYVSPQCQHSLQGLLSRFPTETVKYP